MSEIHGDNGPVSYIPDDLTISQFCLHGQHPMRPTWGSAIRPWLIEEATGRQIGSDELRYRTHGLANVLKERWNIGYDDVVCIFSPNHVDYVVAMWAVHTLGGIVSTANPTYTTEELTYQLQLIKARLLIVDSSTLQVAIDAARTCKVPLDRIILFDPASDSMQDNVQDLVKYGNARPRCFEDLCLKLGEAKTKLALLSFSSGTTGRPKAVMVSHYSIIANICQMAEYLRLNNDKIPLNQRYYRPGSVALAVLPFYHAYGMHMVLFAHMFLATTIVVARKFSLEGMLESIQRYRVTHLCLVPPQVVLLCKSPIVKEYDLSSVFVLLSGAAPVSAELTEQISRILPNCIIGQGYGMTEAVTTVSFSQYDRRLGSPGNAGVLLPGIIARIVRADGTLAGYNEPGELYVYSPATAMGYLNNPTATAETFQNGWVRTGDEVMINEGKEVFVTDRIKELIKVRGLQVAPSELEGHLLGHPDVADVCVIGIADEYSGELPFAFVVPSEDAKARMGGGDASAVEGVKSTIMKHVADHKSPYKRLAGVAFVDAIPKNPSGKLLRRVLRERAKEMFAQGKLTVITRSKL